MLELRFRGLPDGDKNVRRLRITKIVKAVDNIGALHDAGYGEEQQLLINFEPGPSNWKPGEALVIEVCGLRPGRPESHKDTRFDLGKSLRKTMIELFPGAQVICRIPKPQPDDVVVDGDEETDAPQLNLWEKKKSYLYPDPK